MRPALDLMQTVPIFAYLVPALVLFGFGPVAAVVATVIYAMPPMARVTIVALRGVPEEILEFARMSGCNRRQMTWRVLFPAARQGLMVGVNQVIMLSLNMVIIASMIGAGGLGYDVLRALRRLQIGDGLEAGVAITLIAIATERLGPGLADGTAASPVSRAGSSACCWPAWWRCPPSPACSGRRWPGCRRPSP
ncbi:MAG: ABC transporter permease subunit [Arhodomonas sp.]|nr:ABC transporter permease subunit [Arhodomonas sp.]